ncbi:MAG: hypothetical protein H8E45_07015 [Proteobacteria bacterium]|nr:hypothetical protein [Pseudomonadota bacterium]
MLEQAISDGSRQVAVVGSDSVALLLATASILSECAARHGWSERLRVSVVGRGSAAGRAGAADLALLARAGVKPGSDSCPEIVAEQGVISAADTLVGWSSPDANYLLELDESIGKPVLCLQELLGVEGSCDGELPLEELVENMRESMPELLRRIIAGSSELDDDICFTSDF